MMMMMIALEVHLENFKTSHACCREFVKFSLNLWIKISLNFSTWENFVKFYTSYLSVF